LLQLSEEGEEGEEEEEEDGCGGGGGGFYRHTGNQTIEIRNSTTSGLLNVRAWLCKAKHGLLKK
jgi:hypothetical protein